MFFKLISLKNIQFLLIGMAFFFGGQVNAASQLSNKDYESVRKKMSALYVPHFAAKGLKLIIEDRWEDAAPQAYSRTMGSRYIVTVMGGMARGAYMTKDSLALVYCYSIGRLIGGASIVSKSKPKYSISPQADYFATSKCMKRYLDGDDHVNELKQIDIHPYVSALCKSTFKELENQAKCIRSSHAGRSLAWFLQILRGVVPNADFHTSSLEDFGEQGIKNISPQCRLDTYFQGALCKVSSDEEVSDLDPDQGYCSRNKGDRLGVRPACWYSPII
ncbi:MAG: hypothetical protein HOE90_22055 [Bacteriovoracaceae bacterium]|nr:hypothetical protein [Bacteriovoracaceae bacterium]